MTAEMLLRPMKLLVLGDFSGKPSSERVPLAERPTQRVDLDNLDAVMKRMAPRVQLPGGEIRFERLDDFHPDRLYQHVDVFTALRAARQNVPAVNDDLLGRLLGTKERSQGVPADTARGPDATPAAPAATGLDALIRDVVAPHIVKNAPQAEAYVAGVDAAIAEQMRNVLHHPAFQELESAWRGVQWLIQSIELDEMLQLYLLDVARGELLGDIVSAKGRIADTGLHRALVDRWRSVPGEHGWSALAALFDFGPSDVDVGLLAALGLIASEAGGPVFAAGNQSVVDAEGGAAAWQRLRRSEAAQWIGLAAPRVLLRLPYGKASDPIESFAFEELAGSAAHRDFLWGNPALALMILIGRSFTARGWEMEPGDEREIGDMPAYTFERDGTREMQAGAEEYITESRIQALLTAGLIPIASRRDRNAVVAIRFQSVSDPPAALAW